MTLGIHRGKVRKSIFSWKIIMYLSITCVFANLWNLQHQVGSVELFFLCLRKKRRCFFPRGLHPVLSSPVFLQKGLTINHLALV